MTINRLATLLFVTLASLGPCIADVSEKDEQAEWLFEMSKVSAYDVERNSVLVRECPELGFNVRKFIARHWKRVEFRDYPDVDKISGPKFIRYINAFIDVFLNERSLDLLANMVVPTEVLLRPGQGLGPAYFRRSNFVYNVFEQVRSF